MYSFHLNDSQIEALKNLYGKEEEISNVLEKKSADGMFSLSKRELTDFLGFLEDAFNYEDEYADTDGTVEEIYESVSGQIYSE